MPAFKNTLNSLSPDSLSICDNLIAWTQDLNGNDTIDIIPPGKYPMLGLSSMPNLVFNDWGALLLTYSSVTEGYNNYNSNYRHLWVRTSPDGCLWGNFIDLTSSLVHIIDECVFPSVAWKFDDQLHLVYQRDNEPGLAVGGEDPFGENFINYMKVNFWEMDTKNSKGIYVDFRINQDSIFEGDTVRFQNLACGCPYPYSFDWLFEGGIPYISTDQNPDVVYQETGVFDVFLTANNGVSIISEFKPDYITVYPLTSVENVHQTNEIIISPNPTKGIINIITAQSGFGEIEIEIYNILGKNVLQAEFLNGEDQLLKIDLTKYEDGIYFIKIKNGSTLITKKIAVQH